MVIIDGAKHEKVPRFCVECGFYKRTGFKGLGWCLEWDDLREGNADAPARCVKLISSALKMPEGTRTRIIKKK